MALLAAVAPVAAVSLPPLTPWRLVAGWELDPIPAALLVAATVGYAGGIRRWAAGARPLGGRWPVGRSVAFAGGLAAVAVATQSAVAAYDDALLSAHVAQHVLLSMVAPVLFALGAPVTLALRTARGRTRRRLLRVLHARPLAVAAHPAVALALLGGSLVAVYLTPLHELTLRREAAHALAHAAMLGAGCLFFWPLVSPDPVRPRLPHGARVLAVFLTMPFHALVGLAIVGTDRLLAGGWYAGPARAWGSSALADQRTAGGLLWVGGDLVGLVVAGLVVVRWMAADARAAAVEDRLLDARGV